MPWTHLELRSFGVYAPCCMSTKVIEIDGGGDASLIINSTPEQAFQSEHIKKLRQDLSQGIRAKACQNCWMIEDLGGDSMRVRSNRLRAEQFKKIKEQTYTADQPLSLDVKFGTKCNLKCRICSPKASSFWTKEYIDIYGKEELGTFGTHLKPTMPDFFEKTVEWPEQADHVWDGLKTWLPNVQHLELYGGEPFLNKDMYTLLEESITKGVAHKQEIHFNSNGTLFSKKLVEDIFPKFKKVTLSLSLDGIFEQFEYQRHPAKWKTVLSNFEKFHAAGVEVTICISVSALNFFYLPEYLEYWMQKGIFVHLNEVTMPRYFDVSVYPQEIKRIIDKKIKSYDLARFDKMTFGRVETFLQQMNAADNSSLWPEFIKTVQVHDRYRGEEYSRAFPEFANIIGWDKALNNHHTSTEIQL